MKTKIISVSEVPLYFGIWKDQQHELEDTDVVVVNMKNHRIVGAFKLVPIPIKVEQKCKCCGGTGKVEIKIMKGGLYETGMSEVQS